MRIRAYKDGESFRTYRTWSLSTRKVDYVDAPNSLTARQTFAQIYRLPLLDVCARWEGVQEVAR